MPPRAREPGPVSHAELLETVHYDPETGIMVWRIAKPRIRPGQRVGNVRKSTGYRECCVCGQFFRMNWLIWFYMTGEWPKVLVDHRNKDRSDDRWENLRLATLSQNQINSDRWGPNRGIQARVGRHGVKYRVRIRPRDNPRDLGTYDTLEEARAVFDKAAKELYGEFYSTTD